MKYVRIPAWIFLLAGSELMGLAAQVASPPNDPATAVIRYEDGYEATITNWSFLYTYDYDVDARHYSRGERNDRHLYLDLGEKTERGITERFDRTINPSQLSGMIFEWTKPVAPQKPRDLLTATVRLTNGEEIKIPKGSLSTEPRIEPALRLVPPVGGSARNGTVYLVGIVLRDGKKLDFKLSLYFPRGDSFAPSETVVEVRFQ